MKTKSRYLFPLCMVILIMVPGGCVNAPISATATFSPTVTVTSTALRQPVETATITPTAIAPQTEQAESVLPVTLREMQFVPNESVCRSIGLDQIQLEGNILFRSGGINLTIDEGGFLRTQNLYWNKEPMQSIRVSDDGLWSVALFSRIITGTNLMEPTGWVLINNRNGETFEGNWELEEEYHFMRWEIYSSDESGVQMLLFPRLIGDRTRYLSDLKLYKLPAGELHDPVIEVETSEIFYHGKFPLPITFSPNRNRVAFFTHNMDDWSDVHTMFDIKNNRELWSAPEGLQRPNFSIPFWLWAPDSSGIAMPFHQILRNAEEILQADLYLLDSEATSIEQLTTFRESIDGEFIVKPLSWSVDSKKLLVIVDEGVIVEGEQRYYILDFEQNQIIQSCQFQWMRAFGGLWSVDGTRVIFEMGDREHGYSLVEMDASSGDAAIAGTVYDDLELLYWYQE